MKVKFLMAHDEFQPGDVAEMDDAKACDLLCDGVVKRAQEAQPAAPKAYEPQAEVPKAKAPEAFKPTKASK